jgi:hypothetical protein
VTPTAVGLVVPDANPAVAPVVYACDQLVHEMVAAEAGIAVIRQSIINAVALAINRGLIRLVSMSVSLGVNVAAAICKNTTF